MQASQILRDPLLMHTLGNDHGASLPPPGQNGLCHGHVLLAGEILPKRVLENRTQARILVLVRRIHVGERTVRDDGDVLLGMPIDELLLLQVRVGLEFVRERADLAALEQVVELTWTKIGHANVAGQVRADQVFHGPPGVEDTGVLVDDRAARRRVGEEGHGPVHQVEVEIGDGEVAEGFVQRRPDQFGLVRRVPQLGGHPVFVSCRGFG